MLNENQLFLSVKVTHSMKLNVVKQTFIKFLLLCSGHSARQMDTTQQNPIRVHLTNTSTFVETKDER